LTFQVSDTGVGIPPAMHQGIFESFSQVDGSPTRKHGGTGLGLAICKQLVELMSGDISVASTPGKGSTFSFTILLVPGDPTRVEVDAPPPALPLPEDSPKRILLVEDNVVNVKVAQAMLHRLGHQTFVAQSGVEALQALAQNRFDLVLLDIEMPDMDGFEVARRIREGGALDQAVLNPRTPIVALTAHALGDIRQRCLDAGMNDYISKPVELHELAAAISRSSPLSMCAGAPESRRKDAASQTQPLDVVTARNRFGLDAKAFQPILEISLEEIKGQLRLAVQAAEQQDMAQLARRAHTLKSSTATIGAMLCHDMVIRLEAAAKEGNLAEADALLGGLWTEFARAEAVANEMKLAAAQTARDGD